MSPLTCAMRRSRAGSNTRAQSRHCAAGEGRRGRARGRARARSIRRSASPMATPATPQPRPSTKKKRGTTLTPFITSCSTRTPRVRSMRDQPAGQRRRPRSPPARPRCGCRGRCAPAPRPRREAGASRKAAQKTAACPAMKTRPAAAPIISAAHQERAGLGDLAGAAGLGDEAGGAHAQEAEDPVDRGEDDGAEADRADRRRLAELADDRGVDRAEDRDRGVGERRSAARCASTRRLVIGRRSSSRRTWAPACSC